MFGNQTDTKDVLKFQQKVKETLEIFKVKESEHNWEKFNKALIVLIEITRKGVIHYEDIFIDGIKFLRQPIENSLLTDRSRLSGTAINLIEEIFKALGSKSKSLTEIFAPSILKLCNRANKLFVKRANDCLDTIIRNSKSPSLIPKFKEAMQSQNKQMRTSAAQLTSVLLETVDVNGLNHHYIEDLESMIHKGAADSEPAVKNASRKSFDFYKSKFDFRLDNFVARLSPYEKKSLGIIEDYQQQQQPHSKILRQSISLTSINRNQNIINNKKQNINLNTKENVNLKTTVDNVNLITTKENINLNTKDNPLLLVDNLLENFSLLTEETEFKSLISPTKIPDPVTRVTDNNNFQSSSSLSSTTNAKNIIVGNKSKSVKASSSTTAERNVTSTDSKQKIINNRVLNASKFQNRNDSQKTTRTAVASANATTATTRPLKLSVKRKSSTDL
nr:7347_t:CDS:2 [Entrophospora candida]